MADKRVEDYALTNGVSNKEAKRRLKGGAGRGYEVGDMAAKRGGPVAGTGKPKGE